MDRCLGVGGEGGRLSDPGSLDGAESTHCRSSDLLPFPSFFHLSFSSLFVGTWSLWECHVLKKEEGSPGEDEVRRHLG